jgi:hypothetical protein
MVSVAPKTINTPPAPDPGLKSPVEEKSPLHDSERLREKAQLLSAQQRGLENETSKPIGTNSVFANLSNFVKLNTSRAMWGVGFVTAGFAIVSNFLIGSQLLSLIFAVPTLMAFFIAHSLGKGVVRGKNNLFQDSFKLIQTYLENPQRLDTENFQALYAIDELKNKMQKQPSTREEILTLLKRLFNLSKIKLKQIKEGDDSNSARIQIETERIFDALKPLFEDSEIEDLKSEDSSIKGSN